MPLSFDMLPFLQMRYGSKADRQSKTEVELCWVDGRWERHLRWKKKGTEQCTVYSLPHLSIYRLCQPLPPSAHTLPSSFELQGSVEGNMSVTGGVILGGQCFSLKHAQQIHVTAHTRPRLNDSWSGVPASTLLFSALPPLISALIWFDPLAFFSLCCSCYCQAQWHSLSLKQLNCCLGGLTWKGWQLPA